jgi:hypothetical protein
MMSMPYQVGFSQQRWHQVVDVMLEKDHNNPRKHRLRIVALLESGYNQSQRILVAQRLTHHVEDNHLSSEMQYGLHLGKMCIIPFQNTVMSYDIIWQTKAKGPLLRMMRWVVMTGWSMP